MNKIPYEERIETYRDALTVWGLKAQTLMAIEEMAELTKAICKMDRGGSKEDLIDEIADVTIMLEQLRLFFGINQEVCDRMDQKIERLSKRLANESVSAAELELISQAAGRSYKAEDVAIFEITLCDNEVDSSGEKFTTDALKGLSKLFIGKTGILDGDASKRSGTARIFSTELVTDDTRLTADGEPYSYIKAKAFSVKNADNKPLISSLRSGAKIETTVGCSVSNIICSVCGLNIKRGICKHKKGVVYEGKKCVFHLTEPSVAYEFSVNITSKKEPSISCTVLKSFMKGVENYDA